MRALKIIGLAGFLLWMGFVTVRLEQTRDLAMRACNFAWTANNIAGNRYSFPRACPATGLIEPEVEKTANRSD